MPPIRTRKNEPERYALAAAQAIDQLKGERIVILNIGALSQFADYFVIASCGSRVQMRAAREKVAEAAKEFDRHALGVEGEASENWMLLDYGDVVIHLFRPETREHYSLERLWGDAPGLDWQQAG